MIRNSCFILSLLLGIALLPLGGVRAEDAPEPELPLAKKLALFRKIRQCTAKVFARVDDRTLKTGSGVAVKRLGDEVVVVTNAHVVQTEGKPGVSPEVTLQVWRTPGRLSAMVLSAIQNPKRNADVAWLLVQDPGRTLKVADRPWDVLWTLKLKPGLPVFACGNPQDEEFLVTTGTVRSVKSKFGAENMIEHDALIQHGSSGGGLFDSSGMLIGINTSTEDGVHGQAIGIDSFLDSWSIYEGDVQAGNDWPRPPHGLVSAIASKPGENYSLYPTWGDSVVRVLARGRWTVDHQGRTADSRGLSNAAGERIDDRYPYGCLLVRQGEILHPVNQSNAGTDGKVRPDGLYPGAYSVQFVTGKDPDDAVQFRINARDNAGLPGRIHVYVMLNDSGFWVER